jgi:hypothetical protein
MIAGDAVEQGRSVVNSMSDTQHKLAVLNDERACQSSASADPTRYELGCHHRERRYGPLHPRRCCAATPDPFDAG